MPRAEPDDRRVLGEEVERCASERRDVVRVELDLVVEARDLVGDDPVEELLLGAEVGVDQLLVRARAPGNPVDARAGIP
jgi:hypothetical protein